MDVYGWFMDVYGWFLYVYGCLYAPKYGNNRCWPIPTHVQVFSYCPPARWGLLDFKIALRAFLRRLRLLASSRSQWAPLDLNRGPPEPSGTAGPRDRCQNLCQIECQKECQKECQNICQIECQNVCQIKCQVDFKLECQNICQIECQGEMRWTMLVAVSPKTPYSVCVWAYFRHKILCKMHKCHGGDHSK